MTSRIRIDAPTGVIEVEGEPGFVEAQIEKLLPLIEACGFGFRRNSAASPPSAANGQVDAKNQPDPVEDDGLTQNQTAAKRSRKGKVKVPKGQSCADRIMILRNEGYFKEHRSTTDIAKELGNKGWTHKTNQVSAAAGPMFERGDLQRTKDGKAWKYYWDRD